MKYLLLLLLIACAPKPTDLLAPEPTPTPTPVATVCEYEPVVIYKKPVEGCMSTPFLVSENEVYYLDGTAQSRTTVTTFLYTEGLSPTSHKPELILRRVFSIDPEELNDNSNKPFYKTVKCPTTIAELRKLEGKK